jgi:Histidine kinase-, DNA gyrase B-, and HSP90-like ATPase
MAACGSYATAWFEGGPKKYAQTYFTKYLADTVEAGIAGEPPTIRLRSLFGHVREKLAADGRPLPEDRNIDSAGEFPFAHNAAPALTSSGARTQTEIFTGDELGNLKAILTNLSRRNQSLIERQLTLIDSMEQLEQDADRLSSLFRLDHLTTRMRRNSENLLVLAGYDAPRRWSQPIPIVDVLRAAISEIEQYERVVLNVQPGMQIIGQAASDIVHLVAEIVENATIFSRDDTQVYLTGQPHPTSGGVLLDVTDNGLGMSEQELAHANRRLANPQDLDVAVSRRMGLFVVGRLAGRHGVQVQLRHAQSGGLTALIWLPASVATTESRQQPGPPREPDTEP